MDSFFLILRVAVSLAAVLGLIWFINRRWSGRVASTTPQAINLVGRQSLGQKSLVAVVDIDDRRYVLGVGEQNVTLLQNYAAPEQPEPSQAPSGPRGSSVSRSFEQKLRAALALAQGKQEQQPTTGTVRQQDPTQ